MGAPSQALALEALSPALEAVSPALDPVSTAPFPPHYPACASYRTSTSWSWASCVSSAQESPPPRDCLQALVSPPPHMGDSPNGGAGQDPRDIWVV